MPGKIFISYRRDDAGADARSLYLQLEQTFGADAVFMDVDSIAKGLDFTQELERYLEQTSVLLALIGRSWLDQASAQGVRRLDEPGDYVRREISHALRRRIPVIPVLVDGARMPKADELPADIAALANRQSTRITHENFDSDVVGLERDLKRLVPGLGGKSGSPIMARLGIAVAAAIIVSAAAVATALLWKPGAPPAASPTAMPAQSVQTAKLRAAAAWSDAQARHTYEAYRDYLRNHPAGDRQSEAAAAAIPLLRQRIEGHIDKYVDSARTSAGQPSSYAIAGNPRVFSACVNWPTSSANVVSIANWGAGTGGASRETRENTAMAACNNFRPQNSTCTCQIIHVDGKPAVELPVDWLARQLR